MRLYDPARLAMFLERDELDAIVACTRENTLYLGGFRPVVLTLNPYHGVCWVIVLRQAPDTIHIVHSQGEADQILDAVGRVGECALYGTFFREAAEGVELEGDERLLKDLMAASPQGRSSLDAPVELLKRLGLQNARVALDEDGIDAHLADYLRTALPRCQFSKGSDLLREIRRVKTIEEVARLTAAALSVEAGILASVSAAHIGISESAIARHFEIALVNAGARPALTMLKIGRASVTGQRRQNAAILLGEGDVLWFDCDVEQNGYWADVARIYAFGDSTSFSARFAALHSGQREAIDAIRPGMTGDDVFELTMSAVHRAGFSAYRRHHVGHGIGLEPYERPILAPGNRDRIEVGMVISVETPYYEFGLGALHVEDPILVGENGNRRLTRTDGKLNVLTSTPTPCTERTHAN